MYYLFYTYKNDKSFHYSCHTLLAESMILTVKAMMEHHPYIQEYKIYKEKKLTHIIKRK